jgi:predicted ester cyclase
MSVSLRSSEDTVRAFWSLWNARDWEGLKDLVTADFVHHDHNHDIGIDGFIDGSKDVCDMFGGYVITIDQVVGEGDDLAIRWTGRGSHDKTFLDETPSGRQLVVPGMDFYRLEEGRLAENWQIIDMTYLRGPSTGDQARTGGGGGARRLIGVAPTSAGEPLPAPALTEVTTAIVGPGGQGIAKSTK